MAILGSSEFCHQEKNGSSTDDACHHLAYVASFGREGRGDTTIPQYGQDILEVANVDIISQYSHCKGQFWKKPSDERKIRFVMLSRNWL